GGARRQDGVDHRSCARLRPGRGAPVRARGRRRRDRRRGGGARVRARLGHGHGERPGAHPRRGRGARPTLRRHPGRRDEGRGLRADGGRDARGLRPHRHPPRQRGRLLVRGLLGADRGRLGHRPRREPQGDVADDEVRRPAHDRAPLRQDRHDLVARRPAGRAELRPLQRLEGGRHRVRQDPRHRARALHDQRQRRLSRADGRPQQADASPRRHDEPLLGHGHGTGRLHLRGLRPRLRSGEPVRGGWPDRLLGGRRRRAVARVRPVAHGHRARPAARPRLDREAWRL
ncbi:MAG: 3-oxoacyl-[acyl-carrier protein] reductase, partial [uncultured Thermoleophilia bacterium]